MARAVPDYYAVLQVDRNADPLVITRVYRLLASLYHPDNRETGDIERFRLVMEAARVLGDPVRRRMYDRGHLGDAGESNATPEMEVSPPVIGDQQSQRLVLLEALYSLRRSRPSRPDLPLMVLGELLGCTVDEAQFTLWYLRGKQLIEPTEDGWAITVLGVDYVETNHLETATACGHTLSLSGWRALESPYPSPSDSNSSVPAPE